MNKSHSAAGSVLVVLSLILALSASGCATIAMDPKKPLETRQGIFGTTYRQDEEIVALDNLKSTLKTLPASKESAQQASTFETLGLVAGIPGGFMVGWYLGTELGGGVGNKTLLYAGLPLFGLSVAFDLIAQGHLDDAVNAHNKSTRPGKGTSKNSTHELDWQPVLATNGDTFAGGFTLRF